MSLEKRNRPSLSGQEKKSPLFLELDGAIGDMDQVIPGTLKEIS